MVNFLKKLFGGKTEVPAEDAEMMNESELEAEEAVHNAAAGTVAEETAETIISEHQRNI